MWSWTHNRYDLLSVTMHDCLLLFIICAKSLSAYTQSYSPTTFKLQHIHYTYTYEPPERLPPESQIYSSIGGRPVHIWPRNGKMDIQCLKTERIAHGYMECYNEWTDISRWTHISDYGLWTSRRQASIWTNAGLLSIGPLRTNFSGILFKIQQFSLKKMHLKMSSAKRRLCGLGLNVLTTSFMSGYHHLLLIPIHDCIWLLLFVWYIYFRNQQWKQSFISTLEQRPW